MYTHSVIICSSLLVLNALLETVFVSFVSDDGSDAQQSLSTSSGIAGRWLFYATNGKTGICP